MFYHSEFAPHVQTIAARQWVGPGLLTPNGAFHPWVGPDIGANEMIDGYINLLKACYDADTHFDRWEIWTKATPTSIPVLRVVKPISVTGTGVFTGWNEAVQDTITLRAASDNSEFKLIFLDVFTDNNFGKYYDLSGNPAALAVVNYIMEDTQAWQTRKGAQPTIIRSSVITLNERLRREYHLR